MSIVDKLAGLSVLEYGSLSHVKLLRGECTESERLKVLNELLNEDKVSGLYHSADPSNVHERDFYAYALYRLDKIEELRSLVSENASLGSRLALAQAEYKAGNLSTARNIFLECKPGMEHETDAADLAVNISAIDALRGRFSPESEAGVAGSYDDLFNRALSLLVRGQIKRALALLEKANSVVSEDDEKQNIAAQMTFAHLVAGDHHLAKPLIAQHVQLLKTERLSRSLHLVVSNNKTVIAELDGLVEVHHALEHYDDFNNTELSLQLAGIGCKAVPTASQQLIASQRRVLSRNVLKLGARAHVHHSVRRAARHAQQYPGDLEPAIVALHLLKSEKEIAKISRDSSKPELAEAAKLLLAGKVQYPKHSLEPGNAGQLASVLNGTASTNLEEYFAGFDKELAKVGHQFAFPEVNDAEFNKIEHSVAELVGDVDADLLDTVVPPQPAKPVVSREHVQKSRKRKMPANADPSKQPDPERWLAKRDRSGYKSKRSKFIQASQSTQGAEEPAPQSTGEVVGSGPKKTNKKKKKGKK